MSDYDEYLQLTEDLKQANTKLQELQDLPKDHPDLLEARKNHQAIVLSLDNNPHGYMSEIED